MTLWRWEIYATPNADGLPPRANVDRPTGYLGPSSNCNQRFSDAGPDHARASRPAVFRVAS